MQLTKEQIEEMEKPNSNEYYKMDSPEFKELIRGYRAYLAEVRFHTDEKTLLESELKNLADASPVTRDKVQAQVDFHKSRIEALKGGGE